ncbi:H-NS histone family protein [mine drainage metagenome]|uniref:H-NS histone family protein n=1 Tax=mine drainage metagenome TaxID=410659 RepID=A0A1J5QYE3_9ZZZZ
MTSYKELSAKIAALMQQAEAQRKAEIAGVVQQIRAQMLEYNLTVDDLGMGSGRKSAAKGSTVAPKYRHPVSGATWSGRGKMPKWLATEVAAGKDKGVFFIA